MKWNFNWVYASKKLIFIIIDKLAEIAELFVNDDLNEAVATNTHPDEMDDYYEDAEDINEDLRRLQEVTEIENNSDQDEDYMEPEMGN